MSIRRHELRSLALMLPLLLAGPVSAATLTFNPMLPATACGTTWPEHGCSYRLVETTADDYTGAGYCVALTNALGVILMGCRMTLDLAGIDGIETVEIDLIEAAGLNGCSRGFLYSDAGVTEITRTWSTVTGDQTLSMSTGGAPVEFLAISGHECLVKEVRLIGPALATEPVTWGWIKSEYR